MVHDGLRIPDEKGMVPDEWWMKALKESAATAFLGIHFCPLFDPVHALILPFY